MTGWYSRTRFWGIVPKALKGDFDMKKYEVNHETLAVIGIDKNTSRVVENKKEYIITNNAYSVMDESCKYFGSSYVGRQEGSKQILGAKYKLPIVVEESSELIFFPIGSLENSNCAWISLKWFQDVTSRGKKVYIVLKNGKKIECNSSKESIQNQVMRASRLNLLLNQRKLEKNR